MRHDLWTFTYQSKYTFPMTYSLKFNEMKRIGRSLHYKKIDADGNCTNGPCFLSSDQKIGMSQRFDELDGVCISLGPLGETIPASTPPHV